MHTNTQLQKLVLAELEWEPRLDASNIGVAVRDGIVTLTGHVNTYPEKFNAERAVKRVAGVKGVANDIEVRIPGTAKRDDTELAEAALRALEWDVMVPARGITVRVENGWVTLEGEVEWEYQRNAAERAVRHLKGLRGCDNAIMVKPRVTETQVKQKIEAALKRRAELEARQLKISVKAGKVTLEGPVHSWREHDDAVNAAWDTGGVTAVEDDLTIAV